MNNEVTEKKNKRLDDIKAVLLVGGLSAGLFGSWYLVEMYYYNSITPEGQMKIFGEYIETIEFTCVIENAVPNNVYTGEITMDSDHIISSPYLTIQGHSLDEEQKMELAQPMIMKIETLPCYKEFLERVEYDSIQEYLVGRL